FCVGKATTADRKPQLMWKWRKVSSMDMRWAYSATACVTVGAVVKSTQVWAERWAIALGGFVVRPCLWARCWACALARLARSRAVPGFCLCLGGVATAGLTTTQPG